jgi:putative ABC transport system permease protein
MKRARRALDGLDDNIRDHLERETQDNLDRGMAPEEARRQALLKFGNVTLAKEDTRAVWVWQWLEQLVQDLRHGTRGLIRRPDRLVLIEQGMVRGGTQNISRPLFEQLREERRVFSGVFAAQDGSRR